MRHSSSILCRALCISMLYCMSFCATATDASEVNFPALDSSYLKTGDFVGPDHVKRITPGLNKDQVRLELGNPHFSEGIFNVREWDYIFNFYTGKGNEYLTCQFKVKFDANNRATSTHWKNPECEGYVNPPQVKDTPIVPVAEKPLKRRMESVQTDCLHLANPISAIWIRQDAANLTIWQTISSRTRSRCPLSL